MPNAVVVVRQGQSVESAIGQFKKQITKSGILMDYKQKRYYMSKGEEERKKSSHKKGKLKRAQEQAKKGVYDGSRNYSRRQNTNR